MKVLTVALLLSIPVAAQEAPKPEPKLTVVEQTAVDSLVQKFQDVRQKLAMVERDIAIAHPGYHLDENTLVLVADPKPVPLVQPPAVKPEEKPAAKK